MIFSTATELTTVRLSQPAPRADELADITTYGLDVRPHLVALRKKVVYAGCADAAPPRFRPAVLAARVRLVRPKLRGPAYCDVM